MRSRFPNWVLLLYLALDLANPFVPGAFRFTPEEGLIWVEGTSHARKETGAGTSEARGLAPRQPASTRELRGPTEPVRAWSLTTWLVRVRTGDPPPRDFPPPDSDDH